jgi:hypothetical protein
VQICYAACHGENKKQSSVCNDKGGGCGGDGEMVWNRGVQLIDILKNLDKLAAPSLIY